MKRKKFTVSDGKTMLVLEVGDDGYYVVSSPLDPALLTQARTIEEAFEMAADAAKTLRASRKRRPQSTSARPTRRLVRR